MSNFLFHQECPICRTPEDSPLAFDENGVATAKCGATWVRGEDGSEHQSVQCPKASDPDHVPPDQLMERVLTTPGLLSRTGWMKPPGSTKTNDEIEADFLAARAAAEQQ
jgi:hypothetical protein